MADLWTQSWFWPAVAVVVALPILLVILTEVGAHLARRGSPAAKIVRLIRNFVLPIAALLALVTQVDKLHAEVNWTRIIATVLGFTIILVLLNTLNVALFATAERGSWRQRMPTIFIDIARVVIIVVCLAVLFAWVWGADVGGLFTALGVSSIVIGLALQNAAGSVVSGLLLLFEQPFQLGDWLDTGSVKGRVIEVNWRAVHIDTGNGIQIVPTASLAGSSFTNLSEASGGYAAETSVAFSTDDAPHAVIALVRRVAEDLPTTLRDAEVAVVPQGGAKYGVSLPIDGPGEEGRAIGLFLTRLWYSSRRAGLHLDNDLTDDFQTPERLADALRRVAPSLELPEESALELAGEVRLERFGAGERIQRVGDVPDGMRFIVDGTAALTIPVEDGEIGAGPLVFGDPIGLTAYTRQAAWQGCLARTDVAVVFLPLTAVDRLIASNPALARNIGQAIDNRRAQADAALASASTALALGKAG